VRLADVARHGWTTRDLGLEGDEVRCAPDWAALADGEEVVPECLVRVRQVHGPTVVTEREAGAAADAIVSSDSTRVLTVRVADCVPLLLADRRTRTVAAIHAGWRGTAARITTAAVTRLSAAYGSRPGDLVAAIGPAIRPCCYEVGPEVRDAFRAEGAPDPRLSEWFAPGRGDRFQLDVPRANRDQLLEAGIPGSQIYDSLLCTACHPSLFHSYRRDKKRAGRLVGFIRAGTVDTKHDTSV
jgi:YfiH family protein